jgi:hypothetical protein
MTSRAHTAGAHLCFAIIFIVGILALALTGCVANAPISVSDPPGPPANITGNWQFTASPSGSGGIPIAAYLAATNGAVSGSAVVESAFPQDCSSNGCCGGPFAEFNGSLNGTIDAEGNLKLGSAVPNGGPVFTMAGTVNSGTLAKGSFNLTGSGSCAAQGTMAGTEYPALNGTYSGKLTSQTTGQSFTISATFNQTGTLNSRGFFDVNGTANLSGYPCATSASVATPLDLNSGFLGNNFAVTMNAVPGGTLILSGALSPNDTTMQTQYSFVQVGSSCNDDIGTGALTLQ